MKKYIIITLVTILCIITIVNQVRYSKLKNEYLTLQLNNKQISDSLIDVNKQLNHKITELESTVDVYTDTIDSLKNIKKTIVIHKFKESANLSEGVKLLKKNLQCEK
jgi:hypothetical protein